MAQRDWVAWHRDYDDPGSVLSRRGEVVQAHLRAELERAPAGGIGAHRLTGEPAALALGQRLFTFRRNSARPQLDHDVAVSAPAGRCPS
jgi:hypothetical protein